MRHPSWYSHPDLAARRRVHPLSSSNRRLDAILERQMLIIRKSNVDHPCTALQYPHHPSPHLPHTHAHPPCTPTPPPHPNMCNHPMHHTPHHTPKLRPGGCFGVCWGVLGCGVHGVVGCAWVWVGCGCAWGVCMGVFEVCGVVGGGVGMVCAIG